LTAGLLCPVPLSVRLARAAVPGAAIRPPGPGRCARCRHPSAWPGPMMATRASGASCTGSCWRAQGPSPPR